MTTPQDELREKLLALRRPAHTEMSYGNTLEVFTEDIINLVNSEVRQVLESINEPTLEDIGLMPPEQYEGGKIINAWWKKRIEAERKKHE